MKKCNFFIWRSWEIASLNLRLVHLSEYILLHQDQTFSHYCFCQRGNRKSILPWPYVRLDLPLQPTVHPDTILYNASERYGAIDELHTMSSLPHNLGRQGMRPFQSYPTLPLSFRLAERGTPERLLRSKGGPQSLYHRF